MQSTTTQHNTRSQQTTAPFKPQTQSGGTNTASIRHVIRRNGERAVFDRSKIVVAITKAFLAVEGDHAAGSERIHQAVEHAATQVMESLFRHLPDNATVHIENIQDQVELALMRHGEHKIARAYVLYREQRAQLRVPVATSEAENDAAIINIVMADGSRQVMNKKRLQNIIQEAAEGLADIDVGLIYQQTLQHVFDGIGEADLYASLVLSARSLIEREPNYSLISARLLLNNLRREALSYLYQQHRETTQAEMRSSYADYFKVYIRQAIKLQLLDEGLQSYDLDKLGTALIAERDLQFNYLGLQTLYDRYFIHNDDTRIELPQAFFMRVAMGLASREVDRESQAIEFYNLLSSFDFMSSTPTLFNSGTLRPQLSSCYLTTISDDLDGIYSSLKNNALLAKFSGGLGNDWSRVRGLGAHIKGTNGKSQGVVPFLKVANDTAVAVNQGGKRKGAVCAYLETWHIDIEDFLELRKNTGDERRRTHDMNTANWIPDLFMKRVAEEAEWTLFSPNEVPELHELYGKRFEQAYIASEQKADRGEIKIFRRINASQLWRKMLGMLFETGHPWITFKDPCNIRYTNQHLGTVHSSNLCTEITLHTNDDEIAVCNLGSVNLAAHVTEQGLDLEKLERTVTLAMRMLDNVIDYNYYAVPEARRSNLRHRPVGLGIMGFHDALYKLNLAYSSEQAVEFADSSMEAVSYFAIKASSALAKERGSYSSYPGSLWSQGILPLDSVKKLIEERGNYLQCDMQSRMDWDGLRQTILQQGMRNSNCLAIAPTATISNICGVSQSIEPTYQNFYVKSNLSGEFMVVNPYLVNALKQHQLWDQVMVNDLKYFDGSVLGIARIPEAIKSLYVTAFEMDSRWLIEAAARRQKWIDQAQSLNLYMAEASGKKLDQLYKLAWTRGLKTTYYLRTLAATQMEKSAMHSSQPDDKAVPEICSINDPDCEACQ